MNTEEMTKNVQKLEELDTLIDQAREEAEVKKKKHWNSVIVGVGF